MSFTSQLNWRYATKKFNPEKEISQENLNTILESIRMAPTSFGLQTFHVSVISNADVKAKLKAAAWGQEQLTSAPYVLVFSARTDASNRVEQLLQTISGGNAEVRAGMKAYEDMMTGSISSRNADEIKNWTAKQAYIALGFAMAACAELSVDSCPVEGFDNGECKKILNLPENLYPAVLLPIGYRADDESPRAKFRFPNEDMFDWIK